LSASQETFTPGLDGTIPADRIERFLAVRHALTPWCDTFTEYRAAFVGMDELEKAEEDPEAGDAAKRVGTVFSALWEMGRTVGEYLIARNQTLMENGMGLGEYTWIYGITYYSWLGNTPEDFVKSGGTGTKVFHGRVRAQIMEMIARHATDLKGVDELAAGVWQAELDLLGQDEDRIPFQDGLPFGLRESLAPFRGQLEQMFCPATGELEITQTVKTGAWYDHR